MEKKLITMYDSDDINLLWKIDVEKSKYEWFGDGEIRITLAKDKSNEV